MAPVCHEDCGGHQVRPCQAVFGDHSVLGLEPGIRAHCSEAPCCLAWGLPALNMPLASSSHTRLCQEQQTGGVLALHTCPGAGPGVLGTWSLPWPSLGTASPLLAWLPWVRSCEGRARSESGSLRFPEGPASYSKQPSSRGWVQGLCFLFWGCPSLWQLFLEDENWAHVLGPLTVLGPQQPSPTPGFGFLICHVGAERECSGSASLLM